LVRGRVGRVRALAEHDRELALLGVLGNVDHVVVHTCSVTDLESHVAGLSFDDPQPFLVLADALQAEQDPWGELIALQCAGKTELAEALIAKHRFAGALSCEWKYGFVKTVTIAPALDDTDLELALLIFLALPVARLCDGIVLSPLRSELATTREAHDSSSQIVRPYAKPASLFAAIPARITRISFGVWPARPVAAYTAMPRFSDITSSFQRVTELCLVGSDDEAGDAGAPLSLPQCTRLALHCAESTIRRSRPCAPRSCHCSRTSRSRREARAFALLTTFTRPTGMMTILKRTVPVISKSSRLTASAATSIDRSACSASARSPRSATSIFRTRCSTPKRSNSFPRLPG